MYQSDPSMAARKDWPTMYDLPSEEPEDMGLPDELHDFQPELLRQTFRPLGYPAGPLSTGTDGHLYFDRQSPLWYKNPNWFGALDISRFYPGRDWVLSYAIWDENVNPFVVVELLSPDAEDEDSGSDTRIVIEETWGTDSTLQTLRQINKLPTKWNLHNQVWRVLYYFVFNRYDGEFRAFRLVSDSYQPVTVNDRRVWIAEVEIGLGVWQGSFHGINRQWLRWFDSAEQTLYDRSGNWILTPEEYERQRADRAEQQAELAGQEARQERERAERLAAKLRELGIEIE
jgi:Uma2 family endonuclease